VQQLRLPECQWTLERSLERSWQRKINTAINQSTNQQQGGKGGIAVNNHSIRKEE
jgi:hypothetical protein